MAVGVFDSGLGGLTIHQAIAARLPDLPLVYLGDNAHAPYGVRTADDIFDLTCAGVSRLWDEGNQGETRKYLEYTMVYFLRVAIPAGIGIGVLAEPVLGIFTTTEFVAPGMHCIPYILLGYVVIGTGDISGLVFSLVKKTHILAILMAAGAALNLVLNLVLIPHYGIVGAAVATMASYVAIAVLLHAVSLR